MDRWELIAHRAKNLLTVCLAKGIDQAMTAQCGDQWFLDFAKQEAAESPATQIVKEGHKSVRDLDFQALLKILRYRDALATQVLSRYSFFGGLDSFSAEGQRKQLNSLLDRLIKDFRNCIQAHPRAADIEKELTGQGVNRIYGYVEAYQDMHKLAQVFSDVTDQNGRPYADQIIALAGTEAGPEEKKSSRKLGEIKSGEKTTNKKKTLTRWVMIMLGAAIALSVTIGFLAWLRPGEPENIYLDQREPRVIENEISVQMIRVSYEKDELVALCYIVNGTQQPVTDVDVFHVTLRTGEQEIAAANFGVLDGISIAPGGAEKWVFRFASETVFVDNANLSDLQIEAYTR